MYCIGISYLAGYFLQYFLCVPQAALLYWLQQVKGNWINSCTILCYLSGETSLPLGQPTLWWEGDYNSFGGGNKNRVTNYSTHIDFDVLIIASENIMSFHQVCRNKLFWITFTTMKYKRKGVLWNVMLFYRLNDET